MSGPSRPPVPEGERGQAIVLLAIVLLGLIMMVGLAIDAGQLYVARRTMQEAADAAAFGGAVVIYMGGTPAEARSAAAADATKNGYTHGAGRIVVTVNSPPQSGPFVANVNYVEVIIEDEIRTALVPAQSVLSLVRVRGVAGTAPAMTGHAIQTLKPTGNDVFKVSGSGSVTVTGGGIFVNSNDVNAAAHISGAGNVTAAYTQIVGGYQDSGPGDFIPAPTTGRPPTSDPFAGLPSPPTGGLAYHGFRSIAGTTYLDPGIYDGIQISSDDTVYLRPGIYILRHKALQVSGNGRLAMDPAAPASQGLMLFNTLSNYPAAGGTCDQILFSGNGVISLRAMSAAQSPIYKGLVVFQDRNCDKTMQVSGNSVWAATGTVYLPSAGFQTSGNGTIDSVAAQLVVQTVQVSGGVAFKLAYDAGLTAAPLIPALSE